MNRKVLIVLILGLMLTLVTVWVNTGQASQSQSINIPAIDLGQPGLSYRYAQTFGTTEQPYLVDTTHINRPLGLFMDTSDNIYVVEEQGYRMLKYSITGTNLLTLGQAGICYTDDYIFCTPQDMVTDASSNIWIADGNRIIQYDSSGVMLQQFPVDDPWESGSDNDRFDQTRGVAIDSGNHLFVSDSNNHRIQVFDISGGSPVYSATIGTTGVSGSAAGYFNQPHRIAIDSGDNLFVADSENDRVQKCTYSSGWTCSIFDTGLGYPQGITADGTDIYIADTENGRIRKCAGGGSCSDFMTGYKGIYDVAVDSFGNVYGSAAYEAAVYKYDPSGTYLGVFLGVENVPYVTDGYHYNHPRIAIDSMDNLIIIEENGQRLVKLDSQGVFLWSVGAPGRDSHNDNAHFAYPHGVATDQNNNIYVADGDRVQIFNSSGVYQNTLEDGFSWIAGIAVDGAGNIYVSDANKHHVRIYDTNLVYVNQIGVTGNCDTTNYHLCWPIGVEVDGVGNIYVADIGNSRVQKFDSNLDWTMTLGTTGVSGNEFDQFDGPEDVAVDILGRIYVSEWGNRVQVFDDTGAYLTTIGGEWGSELSRFRGASGVAIDSLGNVYVSDFDNARIQKFAPGVPNWKQVNINGFGKRPNTVATNMEIFNNQLYVGSTGSWSGGAAEIWRTAEGTTWEKANETGFGATNLDANRAVVDLAVFNSQLYASTGWRGLPGQIWRSSNGLTWEKVEDNGFDDPGNEGINIFGVFNNQLYVTIQGSGGVEIWRSSTGDNGSWTRVVENGGSDNLSFITDLIEFNGKFYAMVENNETPRTGCQVWETSDGTTWTAVVDDGFGNIENHQTGGATVFAGWLYVGTRNDSTGGEIWRSDNGTDWENAASGGFGNVNNKKIENVFGFKDFLYSASTNSITGVQIWRSEDGITWESHIIDGFGDSNSDSAIWTGVEFQGSLFLGASNAASGAKIWQMLNSIYLPLVVR